jgi:hypothetical protein
MGIPIIDLFKLKAGMIIGSAYYAYYLGDLGRKFSISRVVPNNLPKLKLYLHCSQMELSLSNHTKSYTIHGYNLYEVH